MQNNPVGKILMMIVKIPVAIVHYFFTGIFITVTGISFVWWKLFKYLAMGISFPFVVIGRQLSAPKIKTPEVKIPVVPVAAETMATNKKDKKVINAGELDAPDEKELIKMREKDAKEKIIHDKKMEALNKKEEAKLAKEKEKLEKLNKKKEAEELEKQKAEADRQIKEQQALLKEAEDKKKLDAQKQELEKQKAAEADKPVDPKKQAKLAAIEEKKKLKEEKAKRKQEEKEKKKKLKEDVYVNENANIEKPPSLGDRITDKLFSKKEKKEKRKSIFAKNKENEELMKREALLIDFDSEDAKKSDKKITFEYVGKNAEGKIEKSYFDAFSKVEVHSFLLSEGFEVYSIRTSSWIQFLHSARQTKGIGFKTKDLIFFLTQLSTYIKAGIPLVESLRILSRQFEDKRYQKIFRAMIYDLTMGDNFSVALEKQEGAFPKILVNMVKASEMTGDLPSTLDDMENYFNQSAKAKREMISALTYPTIVFVLAIAALVFIMVYIVPQFVGIYADMDNAELPGITLAVLAVSDFLVKYWMYLLLGVILFIGMIYYLYKNVRLFRTGVQWVLMHIPVIGDVIIYNEVNMFTKTFASLLRNNVFITDTMEILNNITNNEIWKMLILDTVTNLAKGEKISLAFSEHWAVPLPAYEMIVTGERTGQLPEMMQKVSDYYQDLHKNAVARIKSFVEPILILFLTTMVGIIVLSIVIPMFDMYNQIA